MFTTCPRMIKLPAWWGIQKFFVCSNRWKTPFCAINGIIHVLAGRNEQRENQERGVTKSVTCIIVELATIELLIWRVRLHFNSICFSPHYLAVLLNPTQSSQGEVFFKPPYVRGHVVHSSDGREVDTFSGVQSESFKLVGEDFDWHQ